MKVMIISDKEKNIGGAELFASKLSSELKGELVSNPKGTIKNKFLRKIFFDYYNPISFFKLKKVLKKFNPHVVHINSFYGISINTLNKISKLYPTIITAHDVWISEYSKKGPTFINNLHKKIIFNHLKGIIITSPSRFIYDKLNEIGYKKIRRVHNGISLPKKVTNYNKNILFVGRLNKEKSPKTLIKTLNKINKYNILILGEGSLKKELEEKYKNIKFLGFQKPEKYYAKSSILVFPSICEENQPLSILEAMSYGLCVIASNIGGIPEQIQYMKTGLLFEPGNEKDFKKKLDYLLENPSEIKRMGKNARKFVKKNFDWKKTVKKYEKIYKKIIKEFNQDKK